MVSTDTRLIADGGSTKCSWALLENGAVRRFETRGMNPALTTPEEIVATWGADFSGWKAIGESSISYYGAGCIGGRANENVERALRLLTGSHGAVGVYSDMLGAARATLGKCAGIVCIMGTGSNSCVYDGCELVANVRPLGYILGDEGSGADIGKHIVADALKGLFPKDLTSAFFDFAQADYPELIDKIYRQPGANAFLASFAPFAVRNIDEPCVRSLVRGRFRAFFERNIRQYSLFAGGGDIAFVGGVAYAFETLLREVTAEYGLSVKSITPSPIEGLIDFHRVSG